MKHPQSQHSSRQPPQKMITGIELSYFDFEKKTETHNKKLVSKKSTPLLPSASTQPLKCRDINRIQKKPSQPKEHASQKVLSRSKSKPTLTGPFNSNVGSTRTSSDKRPNPSLNKGRTFKPSATVSVGMGGMFKRAVQAKKMIKLGR